VLAMGLAKWPETMRSNGKRDVILSTHAREGPGICAAIGTGPGTPPRRCTRRRNSTDGSVLQQHGCAGTTPWHRRAAKPLSVRLSSQAPRRGGPRALLKTSVCSTGLTWHARTAPVIANTGHKHRA